MAARFGGQLDEAAGRYQEALEAARPAGPTWVVCSSLVELGSLAALAGEDARADELHAEAATLARRTGLRRGTAHVSNEMGLVAPWANSAAPRRASASSRPPRPTCARRPASRSPPPSRPRRPWCWSGSPGWPQGGANPSGPPACSGPPPPTSPPEAFQAATAAGRTLGPDEALRVALG
jgi:hypothetical protein